MSLNVKGWIHHRQTKRPPLKASSLQLGEKILF